MGPLSPEELNRQGLEALGKGELPLAMERFSAAAQANPEEAEYQNNLGVCYLSAGSPARARPFFEQALRLRAAPVYYLNLGVAFAGLNNHDRALVEFQNALKLDEAYLEAWFQKGLLHYALGNRREARRDWERAAALGPHPVVENNLGMLDMDENEIAAAKFHFENAIRLDDTYAQAYFNLGVLRQRQEQYEQAADCYEKATALQAKDFKSWLNLGIVREKLNRIGGAREALEKFLQCVPVQMEQPIRDARRRLRKLPQP